MTRVRATAKPTLEVATPPEFRHGIPGVWSPEDMLVASVASCFALTFVAVAERLGLPVLSIDVEGAGHVEKRRDGHFGFVAVEVDALIATEAGFEERAQEAAVRAKEACIVSKALEVPVHVETTVRVAGREAVTT